MKCKYGDTFSVDTGKFTGRSPKDKWIVKNPGSESEMVFFSTKLKTEMQYEVRNYVANGAVVTAINTEEYTGKDYSPAMC